MGEFGLFDSVPEDFFNFGSGSDFAPKKVSEVLGFKKIDVARITSVSEKSVRFDSLVPEQIRERFEEIGTTINLVARIFNGDVNKTVTWFKTRNPLLGDVSPRDMIRLGKYDRLRKFIITAMMALPAKKVGANRGEVMLEKK